MEILRLALASSPDAAKALDLARQMADFVAGNQVADVAPTPPNPAQASLELTQIIPRPPIRRGRLSLISPGVKGSKLYPPVDDKKNLSRHAKAWRDEERLNATFMLDSGATFVDVAQTLGRTPGAIEKAWRFGLFPTKIQHQIAGRGE